MIFASVALLFACGEPSVALETELVGRCAYVSPFSELPECRDYLGAWTIEAAEAADEKVLTKTIARYGRVDLLCIDELGYMELDRRGAELLFQVLTEREERNSVAIASNESFSGWTKTFTDPRLCAAIVDRLTFGGNLIQTGTESYRLALTQARAAAQDNAG